MSRKYELTDETIMFEDNVLYRIRALKDIPGAVKGDLGGFVRSEENLSQEGDCWIFPESKVVGNSKVSGDATILGEVTIFNDVNITDRAMINGNLIIADNVEISGKSNIFIESGIIRNKVKICDNVVISGKMRISNNVEISGNTVLLGNLKISDSSIIKSKYDFMIFKEFGGKNDDVIWTRSNGIDLDYRKPLVRMNTKKHSVRMMNILKNYLTNGQKQSMSLMNIIDVINFTYIMKKS